MSDEVPVVYKQESVGEDGHIILEIRLQYPRELGPNDKKAIDKAARDILGELHVTTRLTDPKYLGYKEEWLTAARKAFRDVGIPSIYVQQIPNEYCGPKCCPHLPWLLVTTPSGIFKVGWRKRVIVLDWSKTDIFCTAAEAFENEKVTMEDQMIHCWSYEKLTEYLHRLVDPEQPV